MATIKNLSEQTTLATNDWIPLSTNAGATNKISGQYLAENLKTLGNYIGTSDVLNTLDSTATNKALAANVGNYLDQRCRLRVETVSIGDTVIGSNGYTAITSYIPSSGDGRMYLFPTIRTWISILPSKNAINVIMNTSNSTAYLMGTPGDTVKGLQVAFWYVYTPTRP